MAAFKLHGLEEEYERLRALLARTTGDETPPFRDWRPAERLCNMHVCGLHAERLLTMGGPLDQDGEEKERGQAPAAAAAAEGGAASTTSAAALVGSGGGGGGGGGPDETSTNACSKGQVEPSASGDGQR